MSTAIVSRSGNSFPAPEHRIDRAARVALLISAFVSLLAGAGQARAATLGQQDRLVVEVLNAHNRLRHAFDVPPMVWNERLAEGAAKWARHLAQMGYMAHSGAREGENIWMGSAGAFSYALMVSDWAAEGRFFRAGHFPDNSMTGNWQDVGHFTQMVWRDSRQLGCALASRDGWDVLVCRYDSPGNVMGRSPY